MTTSPVAVPTDIAIAQAATMRRITDGAAHLGLDPDDLDLYGRYKAKLPLARARALMQTLDGDAPDVRPLYDVRLPIREKIETIVRRVYGGDGADFAPAALKQIEWLEAHGLGATPVCIAKTPYSLTDDPTVLGGPRGFRVTITEVWGAAGAGFVVARAGDVMTMPGLPKAPAAQRIALRDGGEVVGLF